MARLVHGAAAPRHARAPKRAIGTFFRCAHGLSSLGLRNAKKETPSKRMVFLFLERATGKPPKRCLWQNKRGGFKEVSQWPVPERGRALADTTRAQLRRMHKKTPPYRWCFWSGRRGSNSLPGIPRMAVAIRRNPASPLNLTRFAQVEAASSPVLRHIPKRIPHPVGWGILFGAGDEARTRFPASHEWLSPFAGTLPHLLI